MIFVPFAWSCNFKININAWSTFWTYDDNYFFLIPIKPWLHASKIISFFSVENSRLLENNFHFYSRLWNFISPPPFSVTLPLDAFLIITNLQMIKNQTAAISSKTNVLNKKKMLSCTYLAKYECYHIQFGKTKDANRLPLKKKYLCYLIFPRHLLV